MSNQGYPGAKTYSNNVASQVLLIGCTVLGALP